MRGWATATSWLVLLGLLVLFRAAPVSAQNSDDDESALLVNEGRAELAKHNYTGAASALDRALRVNPRRLDAYILRASVHAVNKQYAQGVAVMRRAAALVPDNLDVLTALGSQLMLAGEVKEGVPILERVIARAPDRYEAHVLLGKHFAASGQPAKAISALTAYLATRPPALAGQDVAVETQLGEVQLRSGDAPAARRSFTRVLERAPDDLKARLGMAWAVAAIDCAEALPLLDRLANVTVRYPEIVLVKGRCTLALGRAEEARALAERYLRQGVDVAAGHALRGEAMLAGGDARGAKLELALAAQGHPENRGYLLRLAHVERLTGDPLGAVKRLREAPAPGPAEAVVPGDDLAWGLELGEGLLAAGDVAGVVATMRTVIANHPDDASARTLLGAALLASGDLTGALAELTNAVALDPAAPRARALLVDTLEQQAIAAWRGGDATSAEQGLMRAAALDPQRATVGKSLGAVRIALGRPADALTPLHQVVVAARGKDPLALTLEGRALAGLGRHAEARHAFEQALHLVGHDHARADDLLLELAASDLELGEPAAAVARLEPALGSKPPPRLATAYVVAARAAAEQAMHAGGFGAAEKLLERAERLAASAPGQELAVRCELALAATAAGDREVATARLRLLDAPGVRCPFPAPADELAVPILLAVSSATDAAHAQKALARLAVLLKNARGPAERLGADATRWIAIRAAAELYGRGRVPQVKAFLAIASRTRGTASPELSYDLAILGLEAGRVDEAMQAFEKLAEQVPEALVALGIAFDRKGDHQRALEYFQRAAATPGLREPRLKDWVGGKQRIWGLSEGAP